MSDIRAMAAENHGWASSREKSCREDGERVPEPVKRMLAFSQAVLASASPEASASAPDPNVKAICDALKVSTTSDAVVALGRLLVVRDESLLALRDAAIVLNGVAKSLEEGRASILSNTPTAAPQTIVRTPISLGHGLVLRHRVEGRKIIFSEPAKDLWEVRTIGPDDSLGEVTSARVGEWFADTWEQLAVINNHPGLKQWSAKSADAPKGQTVIPGAEAPAAAPKPKIADWQPTPEQIGGYVVTLQEANTGVDVSVDLVKSLISKFKAEKGENVAPKPGVSFYHWAVKSLRG